MPILSLKNITKHFPGVVALDGVSMDVDAGEVHALVGENGAGKSTLIKIIAGVWPYGAYEGQLLIDGREVRFHDVRESERSEISIIHQEMSLVNEMTVAENVFLGDEPRRFGLIDYTLMRTETERLLRMLKSGIGAEEAVGDLTVGQQQMTEIAKALSRKARILVLDEPTAALPEKDVERLLALVKELRGQGMAIIHISHKLNEVFELADRITVLRNGRKVSEFTRANLDSDSLLQDMIGRSLESVFPEQKPPRKAPLLNLTRVTLPHPDHPGKFILQDISFTCNKGEVVGIAGLLGSGRTALLSLLFGTFRGAYSGDITYDGARYGPSSPRDALSVGVALVTEDRKRYGLIPTADVRENLCVSSLHNYCTRGIINHAAVNAACKEYVGRFDIKTPSIDFPASNLSGGNQQKVILGRLLMTSPRLLLLDDPTRGIDVGAKFEFYRLIHSLAQEGMGIIFVSSELPEVLGVSHRVIVLSGGRIRGEFGKGEKNEQEALALAAGI